MNLETFLHRLLVDKQYNDDTDFIVIPARPKCPKCNVLASEVTYNVRSHQLQGYCFLCDEEGTREHWFDLP